MAATVKSRLRTMTRLMTERGATSLAPLRKIRKILLAPSPRCLFALLRPFGFIAGFIAAAAANAATAPLEFDGKTVGF